METINSEQDQELTEGTGTDTILQIVIKISELLKKNIDSLNLPTVLKNDLKKIKSFFIPQTKVQKVQQDAKGTSEASGKGRKE